jgi:hypothetical protein
LHIIAALQAREYEQTILGGVKMSVVKIAQDVESGNEKTMCIDTGTYMDDVELAKVLLENANQNGGKLGNTDIKEKKR